MAGRLVAIWACLALTACSRADLSALAHGETGTVAEVRSGDTLVLRNGLVVRLAGIDAPKRDEPFAGQARAALVTLAAGRPVQLLYGGARRDHYGRALAQVRLTGGLWLQQALLRAGDVRVRTYPDNRALAAVMLGDEARARGAARGLWALPAYRVELPAEALTNGQFQLIEGRVMGVSRPSWGTALDLEGAVRAEIPRSAEAVFATAGLDSAKLFGTVIRVRGVVRSSYGRPMISLDHPEQIESLKVP